MCLNISFLKSVIAHLSFRNGEFDINFLNDDFMNSLKKLDETKNIKEIERVSAIFAAILKSKSPFNNLRAKQTDSVNQWQEQIHE